MPHFEMYSSPSIAAAAYFLNVVWNGEAPGDEELLAALDGLLAAYHGAPDTGPSDTDAEAPSSAGPALYQEVANRFPSYGLYAVSDPTAPLGETDMTGDAIDDLADLTSDMREVVWLAENVGADDAHWCLRLLYFHWGRHARELALYLHARQFG